MKLLLFPFQVLSIGASQSLLSGNFCSEMTTVPSIIARLLAQCTGLKSAEDHAAHALRDFSLNDAFRFYKDISGCCSELTGETYFGKGATLHMLTEIFLVLAKRGYFKTTKEIARLVNSEKSVNPESGISSIGFITKNRPEIFASALESYLTHCRRWNRKVTFEIVDSSSEVHVQELYRQNIERLGATYDFKIKHHRPADCQDLILRLTEAGIPEDVLRFGLTDSLQSGSDFGANRNILMLKTSGQRVLSVDDDTLCRFSTSKNHDGKTQLGFGVDGRNEVSFHKDRSSLLDIYPEWDEECILSLHDRYLGKSIHTIISDEGLENIVVEKHSLPLISLLELGRSSVDVTLSGLFGDSGSESSSWALMQQGKTREELISSEERYNLLKTSREIFNAPHRAIIETSRRIMTTFYGFDNKNLLPPFFPCFRNEDKIFGDLLPRLNRSSCICSLPVAQLHSPPSRVISSPELVEMRQKNEEFFDPISIVSAIANSSLPPPFENSREEALLRMSRAFINAGKVHIREFKEMVKSYALYERVMRLGMYQEMLDTTKNGQREWTKDIQRQIAFLTNDIPKNYPIAFPPFIHSHSVAEAEKLSQNVILKYGELLAWWPRIVSATREILASA